MRAAKEDTDVGNEFVFRRATILGNISLGHYCHKNIPNLNSAGFHAYLFQKSPPMKQEDFAAMMEQAYRGALEQADVITANAEKIRQQAIAALEAARETRKVAEIEGDKMADAYFEGRQKQFKEAARTELLRDLVRLHLESGKLSLDIANWLDVPLEFVDNIRKVIERVSTYNKHTSKRTYLEGNPTLRYTDQGRGGTIYFESRETKFDMWWEFAGGNALVILEIPTPEFWEARTKIPLALRDKVLDFIGEHIVRDKISDEGSYVIGENVMTFYTAKR